MNVDFDKIDGLNDRRNLILLLNKKVKTYDDQSAISILTTVYPDFSNYYVDELLHDLQKRGFIEFVDTNPYLDIVDEDGNENEKFKWITTQDGERALAVNFFQSEYRNKNLNEKRREKEDENLDLSNKELKRNKFISWAALTISIISILIAMVHC